MTTQEHIEVDPDATFCFKITDKTTPRFKVTVAVSEWLVNNLSSLKDDDNKTIFNKVSTGFNQDKLKTFSGHPTCDVYINGLDYDTDFDYCQPVSVNSIVLFYFKGANNKAYMKACELHDYLMQELITNDSWRSLTVKDKLIVKDTVITNSKLMMQPINKKWGCMGAFELSHKL